MVGLAEAAEYNNLKGAIDFGGEERDASGDDTPGRNTDARN